MEIMRDNSGNLLVGEIVNDAFVVQSGPDFDATFEVYAMDEVTPAVDPMLAAVVQDAVEFPSELDNAFSDAVQREEESERIDAEQLADMLRGVQAYVDSIDRAIEVINEVCAGKW